MKKALLAGLLLPVIVQAQPFSIGWYKIAGGGGTSGSGEYSISGTIGQSEAGGAMSGGNFSVTGGFWSMISVVATAGAPTLVISHSAAGVIVSWPASAGGWTLQQTSDLSTGAWGASAFPIANDGVTESITISNPSENLFFRLIRASD